MFFDTHCHIHDAEFYADNREEVYRKSITSGVNMIVVGTSEASSLDAVEFANSHEGVWSVVGVHPHDVKNGWQGIRPLLDSRPDKLVGVGEIGLDYFYDNSPRDLQIKALEEQLQWATDFGLAVSFHVRNSFDDFWPVLDNFSGVKGVLHSFTDTRATLDEALSRGLYVGVNGISTFTRDAKQQEMFDAIPLDNLLFETDAPFLTPAPHRGKVNEPARVQTVVEYHAARRKVSVDEIVYITTMNAKSLFAI